MIKNPYIAALLASSYIGILVCSMFYVPKIVGEVYPEILVGVTMLSLLVFSVATMAYLFFFQPAVLFFENKKAESVRYFLTALVSFVGCTVCLLVLFFLLKANF